MAAPDVTTVQGAAGTLYWNPTSLSAGSLTGGTQLGLVTEVSLIPVQRTFPLRAEDYGGKGVEEYEMGRDWIMSGLARGLDDAMLARLGFSVSSSVTSETLTQNKGAAMSARAGVLLFKPNDAAHYGFVLWNAMARVRDGARIPWSLHNRLSYALVFRAIPDSSGNDVTIGPYESLSI